MNFSVALCVHPVVSDLAQNIESMEMVGAQTGSAQVDLILFGAAALSGRRLSGNPVQDRQVAHALDSTAVQRIANLSEQHQCWLGFGFYEAEGEAIYKTAVLYEPGARLILKQRSLHPDWPAHFSPDVYRAGSQRHMGKLLTHTVAFLLTNEIFRDDTLIELNKRQPDLLLYPLALGVNDMPTAVSWESDRLPQIAQRVKLLRRPTLLTNILTFDNNLLGFGGAGAMTKEGFILDEKSPQRPGILHTVVTLE